jgi:hypothetical protein
MTIPLILRAFLLKKETGARDGIDGQNRINQGQVQKP